MKKTLHKTANISRRRFNALLLGAASTTAFGAVRRDRPNIIFILADDLGYGDTSSYGQKKFRTPHIDRLAAEGMRFTHAYAGSPVCSPARCTLMTGLHAGHARVRDNFALAGGHVGYKGTQPIRRASLLSTDKTVADLLKSEGYSTGLVGKWHLDGYDPEAIPNRHGFDHFRGWLTQKGETQGYYPTERYHNQELVQIPENRNGKQGRYETDMVTEDAVAYIREHASTPTPFFLYIAYSAPHSPYISPDHGSYDNQQWDKDEKTYAAMIERMDAGIGRVCDVLKERHIEGETIVFFASDNGPRSEPMEAQTKVVNFFDSNGELRGYKRDLYEGGIRVPLIAKWPDRIAAGRTNSMPIYFPDFLPTALELASGSSYRRTDGVSIVPQLFSKRSSKDRYLYWEFYEPEFRQAARFGRWKAVRLRRGGPLELYDLSVDPSEEHNVAAKNASVIAHFENYMQSAHVASFEYPDMTLEEERNTTPTV